VGRDGSVHGLDLTDEQVAKAERVRSAAGIEHVEFVGGHVDDLPFPDGTFDVVMSNGVINLASDKMRVFKEIERVLRPGGRASIADIVSSTPLAERTVAKVELWAACVAGAVPGLDYLHGLEDVGLTIGEQRDNTEYHFISDRAATTCAKYGIKSVSLIAEKLPA
jgi:SAM-dependent methyltransferase